MREKRKWQENTNGYQDSKKKLGNETETSDREKVVGNKSCIYEVCIICRDKIYM